MEKTINDNDTAKDTEADKSGKKSVYDPGPIVMETDVPGIRLDFNCGVRLRLPDDGNYHLRITDQDTMLVLFDSDISKTFAVTKKKYYINYLVELWKDGYKILTHPLSLEGKKVRLFFPAVGVLGDVLAWFPYAEAFRKKHGCRVYCLMTEQLADIFRPAYPEIVFLPPGTEVPDSYASYFMGAYLDTAYTPIDHRQAGLGRCIPYMLGLKDEELRPVLTPCPERPIAEPYVCIATKASAQRKYWNNPRGWTVTVDYLKSLGYRVLCIDKDRITVNGDFENDMPAGAEDFTGDLPLQQRVDLLGHADFFIGLSSGLSWLAWGAGTPVILISGFTLPLTEFYTPYRVIQYNSCYGCWNDSRIDLNMKDVLYCPKHGGTKRAFECSRFITPEYVCKTIDRLMADLDLPRREHSDAEET